MIKSIKFENFRNVEGKFCFDNNFNIVVGKNNSGKTNLLDGIRLAFSTISDEFFKIEKSDFSNSDDSNNIVITVELESKSIESLKELDEKGDYVYGFKVTIRKTQRGRYVKEVSLLSGSNIDFEILREDKNIPAVSMIPLSRIDSLLTNGYTCSISNFLKEDNDYQVVKEKSKEQLKSQLKDKVEEFQSLCSKFNQNLDIEFADPKISDEKIYIVEQSTEEKEHNYKIGSGYRSVANILINTLNEGNNIILIDEIENHLHPALARTLIREFRSLSNVKVIGTTHSAVILNELPIDEIIDISCKCIKDLSDVSKKKLDIFLHAGRSELILADNVVLVEGYTEEMLFKNYLYNHNYNWTVVNLAGVVFEPYIDLCTFLNKKTVVISDNDRSTNDGISPSSRFEKLKTLCKEKRIKLIEVDNTLETDLFQNGYLENCRDLMCSHQVFTNIKIAKTGKKTEIAFNLIKDNIDLSEWHVIQEINNEFNCN